MTKRLIAILLGVFAFFIVLGVGAAAGGALVFFAMQARPVKALASNLAPAVIQVDQENTAGLLVSAVAPSSPADRAGLQRGDILLQINGQAVNDLNDLARAREGLKTGDSIEFNVHHGDDQRSLTTMLEDQDKDPLATLLSKEALTARPRSFFLRQCSRPHF